MPTYTTAEYIEIGQVSTFLSRTDVAKGAMYGQTLYPNLPVLLAMETDSVNWIYGYDAAESTLPIATRYLYSLCGSYAVQAIPIISGGGGGTVTPTSPTGYIYTSISDTITANSTTYYNALLVGGKDLNFVILNNQVLTIANGDFTYNSTTGVLTFITVQLFIDDEIVIPLNRLI